MKYLLLMIGFILSFPSFSQEDYSQLVKEVSNQILSNQDVSIVGIGESCHGTNNINQVRKELILEMIDHGNLKFIGIEERSQLIAELNELVRGNESINIDSLFINEFLWPNKNTQLYDLILKVKAYNSTRASSEHVQLFGINGYYKVYSYKHQLDTSKALKTSSFHHKLDSLIETEMSNEDKIVALQALKAELYDSDSLSNFVRYDAHNYIQGLIYTYSKRMSDRFSQLDVAMFENVRLLNKMYSFSHEKMIAIWAHNGHVSNSKRISDGMGKYLKKEFNQKYFIVGVDFVKGSFVAVDFKNNTFNLDDRYNGEFQINQEDIYNDLIYTSGKIKVNAIGAMYNETHHLLKNADWYKEKYRIGKHFDLFIRIPHTEKMEFVDGYEW